MDLVARVHIESDALSIAQGPALQAPKVPRRLHAAPESKPKPKEPAATQPAAIKPAVITPTTPAPAQPLPAKPKPLPPKAKPSQPQPKPLPPKPRPGSPVAAGAATPVKTPAVGPRPVVKPSGPLSPPKDQQMAALLRLKAALDPRGMALKDWKPARPYCDWPFVSCDPANHVTRLNLAYLLLDGKFPSENIFASLPWLVQVNLGGNLLKGSLPPLWGNAAKLKELFIADNMLSGALPPQWSGMKSLAALSLNSNQLSGAPPPSWGALNALKILKLSNNGLTGALPTSWGSMSSLSAISLFGNPRLSGCIPKQWTGKGSSGAGYFYRPTGGLTTNIKEATASTAISGYCSGAAVRLERG